MTLIYGKQGLTMNEKERYVKKIKIPIFQPKGINVSLNECVDIDKFLEYMEKIDTLKQENKIDENQYKFLKLSATRFIVFNFENIAEYFCNANADMQKIMQELALVLIDYDDALKASIIEAGEFTNKILKIQDRYDSEKKELDIKTDFEENW